jgi:flagellar biosynthesis/type III secretory pathway M-ring protein FliF/YscJ
VRVASSRFAKVPGADELTGEPTVPVWMRWAPFAAAALGLVALSAVVLVWRQKKKKKQRQKELAEKALAAPAFTAALAGGEAPSARQLEEAVANAVDVRARALELASKDPATAAIVLRKWLNAPTAPVATARS